MKYVPLVLLAILAAVFISIACSTPDNHPAIIGDCAGPLCPPAQNQSTSAGSSSGSDATVDSAIAIVDSGAVDAGDD